MSCRMLEGKNVRKAAQITGSVIVAAVLMTGCGSNSDKGDEGEKRNGATSAAPAPKSSSSSAAPSGQGDGGGTLDGIWNRQNGTDIVRVTIFGDRGISDSSQGVCNGSAQRSGSAVKLDLKCPGGDNSRAKGTATLQDGGKTLAVGWDNGTTEKFTKDPIKVEMPKIEVPKIEVPKIEVPSAPPAN